MYESIHESGSVMLPDNLKTSRCESLKTNQTMVEHLIS
jgi:hypothetical protein